MKSITTPIGVTVTIATEEEYNKMDSFSGYKKDSLGNYRCKVCNRIAEMVEVSHPVWDGPFAMSGSGSVIKEEVPYCWDCDKGKLVNAFVIATKGSFHNP
uniref:Uncharacterized protein n=1 Tax=candidate division CPR3 bacterium TaxID=2268181 RepID=A0A7C4RA38_UNCC3